MEQSYTIADFTNVIAQIGTLLPILAEKIRIFNDYIMYHNINVVFGIDNSLSLDLPSNMPDDTVEEATRILQRKDLSIINKKKQIERLIIHGRKIHHYLTAKEHFANTAEQLCYESEILTKIRQYETIKSFYRSS